MAPQFCSDCGTILHISAEPTIACDICGTSQKNKLLNTGTTTRSAPSAFPSRLRSRLQAPVRAALATDLAEPTINMECPQCDGREVGWSQAQLRSADEGTTIFYVCKKCGHRWQENN